MRIDYPEIGWADVRSGDTLLSQRDIGGATQYVEFTVLTKAGTPRDGDRYYLIDRPAQEFPTKPGLVIIAKKVRGSRFPEGLALVRLEAHSALWVSHGTRINGMLTHSEYDIEDWILAKVVPA